MKASGTNLKLSIMSWKRPDGSAAVELLAPVLSSPPFPLS
jgi:hypothetical protein